MAEEGVLAASDIHKRLGAGTILDGASLELRRGEIMVVIGPSGCGKTTLLRTLVLLDVPERGEIRLDGRPVPLRARWDGTRVVAEPAALRRLRRRCGVAFQGNSLWSHLTVLENVVEASITVHGIPRRAAEARAMSLLESLGIGGLHDRYPLRLSGGQQQRTAIARALATDPDVLLLDEPTSALDPVWTAHLTEMLRSRAAAHKAVLVVTHDLGFARSVATTIVSMDRGRVLVQGPPGTPLTHVYDGSSPADQPPTEEDVS